MLITTRTAGRRFATAKSGLLATLNHCRDERTSIAAAIVTAADAARRARAAGGRRLATAESVSLPIPIAVVEAAVADTDGRSQLTVRFVALFEERIPPAVISKLDVQMFGV